MTANTDGLNHAEAERLLKEYGPNEIYSRQKISFLGIARHEITEPMILLLLFIGVIYSIWGSLFDAATIIVVIVILVIAEVNNEFRAKKAITALEQIAAPQARVFRDGIITEIDTLTVVPGDLLVLTAGTRVAADGLIRRSIVLQVNESALTGESFPVEKSAGDEIYAGTIIVSGEGDAEVEQTGKATRLGKLAASAQSIRPPRTRLQLEMKALAGKLVFIAAFFSILITVVGILQGNDIRTMVLTGLSLAFATIPEELPIIITMVLGLGAYQLSKHKFLVKQLKAAETMGTATVIVTDKTGTLTESRMHIAAFYPPEESHVLGVALKGLSLYAQSPIDQVIRDRVGVLALKEDRSTIVKQRDFGNGRKTRSVIREEGTGLHLHMNGAPEEVFSFCTHIPKEAQEWLIAEAENGRRVIAVASRILRPEDRDQKWSYLEKNLEFVGLISFVDPPREGVKETIAQAAEAGIRTIMVTGDHPGTAAAIAREIGIFPEGSRLLTGTDLDAMSDTDLQAAVSSVPVFARTTPDHKFRIVQALQKNGEIVAVTGDGINDALALRGADIGIAMGIRGTDVAKDAAGVVLADDNYITITNGIFEGRKFADNLRKGIRYYLSIKLALIMIFLLPVFAGIALPFAPIQIIVLELFMDLGASAGFVAEPAEGDIYTKPHERMAKVLSRRVVGDIILNGIVLFVAVMVVYFTAGSLHMSTTEIQTYTFSAWIFGHIALAYMSRTDRSSLLSIGVFSNRVINIWAFAAIAFLIAAIYVPVISRAISLIAIPPEAVFLIALVTMAIISLLGLRKVYSRRIGDKNNEARF
jgi:Ca2+-transporting ATPase